MQILSRAFYNRPTITVAKQLLGKILCRRIGKKILRSRITEVEAYVGPDDKASHASRGKTKRNSPMFGPSGIAYIYLIYGMYWCLNIVTEQEGYPAAVLIRGVDEINGPGRLCRAFQITGAHNGITFTEKKELWIEDAPFVPRSQIFATPRIGVDYAEEWKEKPFRFLIKK